MPAHETQDQLSPGMARHLRVLGCADVEAYFAFCRGRGFAASLAKSIGQRVAERKRMATEEAARKTRKRVVEGLLSDPRRFIKEATRDGQPAHAPMRPGWSALAAVIRNSESEPAERKSLANFLMHLHQVSHVVFAAIQVDNREELAIQGLLEIHRRRGAWRRDPRDWRPERHDVRRQFASLVRHLFAEHPTPRFLENAWLRSDAAAPRYRDWYVHLGAGRSMRAADTPYPMSRKIAHLFVTAPDDLSIEAALIWADVAALGGDRRLTEALAGTRLGRTPESDPERRAFWRSVYRFFIDNPMLDPRLVGPIVDYLAHQKFEPQRVMVGEGRVEQRPPPQPNLSMARRNPATLLRQVEAWHASLSTARKAEAHHWPPSGRPGIALAVGFAGERPELRTRWTVSEILTLAELVEEGRLLRHCVASYARRCARGEVAIWSIRRQGPRETAPQRVLTLATADDFVTEVRGLANRLPTAGEWAVVKAWMREADLSPAPYLRGWPDA